MAALKFKTSLTKDKSNGRQAGVTYIKVLKTNRKGLAKATDGKLCEHEGAIVGDFHLLVPVLPQPGTAKLKLGKGDVLFKVGKGKHWQGKTVEEFKKRFPDIKL